MIFKYKNIEQRYSGLIFALIELCFLIELMSQNICAYPHQNYQNNTKIDFENKKGRRIERYTSNYENSNASFKILSRNQERERLSWESMLSDAQIVFPEDQKKIPSCRGSTFCEKVDSYPEDVVNTAIQRNESIKYLAAIDILSDISQRIDFMDDSPLCQSNERVIFPKSAMNKDNEWKYVANQENFKQGIRVEVCEKQDSTCNVIGNLPLGYKSICKQKFIQRELLSVSLNGSVSLDTFLFPSSCCCYVTFTANTRMIWEAKLS